MWLAFKQWHTKCGRKYSECLNKNYYSKRHTGIHPTPQNTPFSFKYLLEAFLHSLMNVFSYAMWLSQNINGFKIFVTHLHFNCGKFRSHKIPDKVRRWVRTHRNVFLASLFHWGHLAWGFSNQFWLPHEDLHERGLPEKLRKVAGMIDTCVLSQEEEMVNRIYGTVLLFISMAF